MQRLHTIQCFLSDLTTTIIETSVFSFCSTTALTLLVWLFGAWDIPLQILLTVIVLDYSTALINAYMTKTISSSRGFKGLIKKSGILIVIILAVLVDRLLNIEGNITRTFVAIFFISNESLSVIENLGCVGIIVPPKLIEVFEQLRKGNKKETLVSDIYNLEKQIEEKETEITKIDKGDV